MENMQSTEEYLHIKYVNKKLQEAELDAQKPGAQWTDYKKNLKKLREKYSN